MSTAAPRTIKAYAAFSKDEPVKQWQFEARPLGAEDVEIKVSHCGICGSDVHTIDGGWGPFQAPCVPGHEIIGEITQVGSGVTTLKVGDRVGVGAQVWACLNKDADKPCKACASGADAYCSRAVWSFNNKYEDGSPTYGGFAEYVRAPSSYTFKIPANISSEEAAPLMCAGATVFTPFKEAGVKPGDRVGIIGIGGLGHVAVQFAKAMGATVVAFSRSDKKKAEALQLGADEFVNYGDDAEAQKAAETVDVLLLTADATNMPYDLFMTFLSFRGTLIMVGLPNDQLKLYPFNLVPKGRKIVGSCIGSIADIKEMLQLASEKNVRPVVQVLPISEVNKALGMVRDGSVRYRAVLKHEH